MSEKDISAEKRQSELQLGPKNHRFNALKALGSITAEIGYLHPKLNKIIFCHESVDTVFNISLPDSPNLPSLSISHQRSRIRSPHLFQNSQRVILIPFVSLHLRHNLPKIHHVLTIFWSPTICLHLSKYL